MARGNRHHLLSRLASVGGTALIISSLLLTIGASGALALDSGAKSPSATATPNQWTSASNAFTSDGTYATARPTDGNSLSQGYTTFGLGVPNGSIIDGITVKVIAKSSDSSGCQLDVRLSGSGGTNLRTKTIDLTNTDTTYTLGSATDTWGQVWDPTQLTNGNFQVNLRALDGGTSCNDSDANNNEATTSVDNFTVLVTYRTIDAGTKNADLSGDICKAGDFSFVIDMSGSIGEQGNLPSNLQQMKDGINGFVNAFQGGGGDGLYAGTKFSDSSATNITSGFKDSATFLTAVNALSGPAGLTPTYLGINGAVANTGGGRAGVPNVMFVLTDGSPNKPNAHSDDLNNPETWLTGANGAVKAANDARTAGFVVEAVYLSTPQDPGDTSLPFSDAGKSAWATTVMDRIGGGTHFDSNFTAFVNDLFAAINCPPPPPITTQASAGVDLGGSITDTAHLIGGASTVGSITFKAYGPDDANCSTVVFTSSAVAVNGTGNYTSTPAYTPSQPGLYRWRAFYTPTVSGNPNNPPSSTACNDDNESVIVKAKPSIVTSATESVTVGTAVTDSATLSNATATASGTITFKLYSDASCTVQVGSTKTVDIGTGGNGTYGPVSITPGAPGLYHWIASYSGDSRNKAVSGACGADGENDTVIKAKPTIATVASGSGTPNAIDIGGSITDTATLSGGMNPTGTISFTLYGPGDTTCTGNPVFTSLNKPVSGGSATSDAFTPLQMGKYRWVASYSGDANNDSASGACNASNEDVVVKPAAPGITTNLSGAGQSGANITVPLGTAVTDSSSLSGATATAGGTVKYTVFSDSSCLNAIADLGTKNVINHVPGDSNPFTVTSATTYYFQAEYSGDNNNKASTSGCALETVTVTKNQPKVDTQASATVAAGGSIHDTANLSGGFNPTGTIIFKLYGPNDATCAGTVQLTTTVPVAGNGTYFSADFAATLAGTYRWIANYSGDANNAATANACNGANENVDVTKTPTKVDTQASGSVEVGGDIWDVATLSGGVNPTGTITFKLYGADDTSCTGAVKSTSIRTVNGNGQYTSDQFTTTAAGTWRWVANYSGDANNQATANTCNAANENVSVTKKSPTIATVATVGGQPGDKIHDTSALTGEFNPTGGTVTFKLYGPGDNTCAGTVTFTSQVNIAADGTATSGDFTTVLAGTYKWTATYSGDANNVGVASKCGDDNETTTLSKFGPDITTKLTSGDVSGAKITVLFGSAVTDQATLTGFGPGASGKVEYNVYSDDQCQNWFAGGGSKDVVNGVPGPSDSVNFPVPGKFYWQAAYLGDANNAPATSACTDEVVTVTKPNIHAEKLVDGEHSTQADPGDVLTYSIKVTNSGDAAGTADISDDVAAIDAHATISDISDSGTLTAGVITWPQFNLAANGGTKTVTFKATLDASFPNGETILPNAVVVLGTGSNCTPQDNEDADCNTTTKVEAHPSIHAEKTVDGEHATQAVPGDVLHYAIKVTNSGDAAGTADISDDVSAILAHATINNVDISDGGTLTAGTITWPQFMLAANGGTKTVTFTATLDDQFPAGTTTLPNAVVVVGTGSNCPDTSQQELVALSVDPDCDTTTTVEAAPHLTAFKLVSDGNGPFVHSNTARPGDILTWKIVITNDGNAPVSPNLHAEDIKTVLLFAKYNDDCTGDCDFNGGILKWTILNLAAKSSVTLTFSVTLNDVFPQGTTNLPNAVVVEDSNCVPEINEDADCTTNTTVSEFLLTIDKTNNAPLETLVLPPDAPGCPQPPVGDCKQDLPTADEGSTVTYTLAYHVGDLDVDDGVIHDVLPVGVTYVANSATSNSEFTFVGYDAGTRTLSWGAAHVTQDGTLSYMAKVDTGASLKSQPLENTATIQSAQTGPDSDVSDVYVPTVPGQESHKPTPPPTDTFTSTGPANPGSSLALILAALGTLMLGISFITPVPAVVRRRNRR